MKINLLVRIFSILAAIQKVTYASTLRSHEHSYEEQYYMATYDGFEYISKLFVKVLHLDKRMPRDSHKLEFYFGFFDAAFKF